MSYCPIALPSFDDACVLTKLDEPDAIVDFYLNLGAEIVALKIGARGVLVATPNGRQTIAPFKVASIDANAAGDTFAGAFLSELNRDRDPFQAARYANAAAAISTTKSGAVASIPDRETVLAFMQRA